MEAMAAEGVTIPSTQDVAWITSRQHPWHRTRRDTPIEPDDLVAFEAGVIRDGYIGELGRTRVAGEANARAVDLFGRRDELCERLIDACRPGAPLTGLLDAYDDAGVAAPPMPVARGLGLGYDTPVVTHALRQTAAGEVFEPGMVLALAAYVWQEGVGAAYVQEPVVITEGRPELLSSTPVSDR